MPHNPSAAPATPVITYREYTFDPDFPIFPMVSDMDTSSVNGLEFHFHNYPEFAFCQNGTQEILVEGRAFCLHRGDLMLIPSYQTHYTRLPENSKSASMLYLYLDHSALLRPLYPNGLPADLLSCLNRLPPLLLTASAQPQLTDTFSLLHRAAKDRAPGYGGVVRGLALELLCQLSRLAPQQSDISVSQRLLPSITPALAYINEHCCEDIAPETLAVLCHISRRTLLSGFKAALGQTPQHYQQAVRIQTACRKLSQSEKNITDIAFELGFSSVSLFSRLFSEFTGQTPRNWRNLHRVYRKDRLKHSVLRQNADA